MAGGPIFEVKIFLKKFTRPPKIKISLHPKIEPRLTLMSGVYAAIPHGCKKGIQSSFSG
jgi:hypothetical protein